MMTRNNTRQVLLGACFFFLGLAGCAKKDFSEQIVASYEEVEKDQKRYEVSNTSQAQWLSWKHAVRLLKTRNLTLARAQEQLREINRERETLPLQMLDPKLRVVTSLGTALGDLSNLDSNDYGLRLLGTINIPSPATYYARRYGLELQYYSSKLDLELLERRLIISLYEIFLRQKELDRRKDANSDGGLAVEVEQQVNEVLRQSQEEESLKQDAERIRLSLNRLLDTPGSHWVCQVPSMPQISYVDKLSELDPANGYGSLAMKQAAGQIEAALLRVKSIKLRRWPVFSTGVSLPTLYNSREEQEFDIDETNLFASFGKSFDFTGTEARSLESAEKRAEFAQRSLRQRLEVESSRLRQAKLSYQRLLSERERLMRTRAWLLSSIPRGSGDQLLDHVEGIEGNFEDLLRNERGLRQLDLQFWVWDEKYWKKK